MVFYLTSDVYMKFRKIEFSWPCLNRWESKESARISHVFRSSHCCDQLHIQKSWKNLIIEVLQAGGQVQQFQKRKNFYQKQC